MINCFGEIYGNIKHITAVCYVDNKLCVYVIGDEEKETLEWDIGARKGEIDLEFRWYAILEIHNVHMQRWQI